MKEETFSGGREFQQTVNILCVLILTRLENSRAELLYVLNSASKGEDGNFFTSLFIQEPHLSHESDSTYERD